MEIDGCQFPDDLLYDVEENVWARIDKHVVTLGITCVFASIAGKIKTVQFRPVGLKLEAGKSVATVESQTYFGVVRSPVRGELVEINDELLNKPYLANRHPYAEGWFARISPLDWEFKRLLPSTQAGSVLRQLVGRLHVRCFAVYPDYEVSGIGGGCPETLAQLDELMQKMDRDETVHLVSDNRLADTDVPKWVSLKGHRILESRREGSLIHFIIGRQG